MDSGRLVDFDKCGLSLPSFTRLYAPPLYLYIWDRRFGILFSICKCMHLPEAWKDETLSPFVVEAEADVAKIFMTITVVFLQISLWAAFQTVETCP